MIYDYECKIIRQAAIRIQAKQLFIRHTWRYIGLMLLQGQINTGESKFVHFVCYISYCARQAESQIYVTIAGSARYYFDEVDFCWVSWDINSI